MSAHPSHDEILAALKKSGYLMEQEVATQLETLGFHVNTNWAFKDSDEGKSREIDVRAIKRVAHNNEKCLSAFVEILVECKNNANPFVFIGRKKNQTDNQHAPQELVFPVSTYEMRKKLDSSRGQVREIDAFFHLGFDEIHYDFARNHKTVQFCRLDRKGNEWSANHGNMYNALFFPVAKAITIRKKEIWSIQSDRWRYFWFFIPIVILSGDMHYVDSRELNPVPRKSDYVTFKREIRSGSLDGTFAIEFVRQKRLEAFISDCVEPLAYKMTDLTENLADLVLTKNIPWDG